MLGLPKSTEFNKRIPKQKFYDNLAVTPAWKKVFIEQVKAICWRNKIAAATMNLAPGAAVTELVVFEVKLNSQTLDDSFCGRWTKKYRTTFSSCWNTRASTKPLSAIRKNPAATQPSR